MEGQAVAFLLRRKGRRGRSRHPSGMYLKCCSLPGDQTAMRSVATYMQHVLMGRWTRVSALLVRRSVASAVVTL